MSRVLPMPGSPTTITSRPLPDSVSSKSAFKPSSSCARPTKRPKDAACVTGVAFSAGSSADTGGRAARRRWSSATTAPASAGRAAGSFSSNASTSASIGGVTFALCHVGETGAVFKCCEMTVTASSPRNGGRPVSISYSEVPNA